ncbi:MAG: hypothetical protein NVSMB18_03950 [Acetobacteraceae bacterium]
MPIKLADAIQQLREQLSEAMQAGQNQNIVFTPASIDLELAITFKEEAQAKGGFKLLAFLDLSAEAKVGRESQHKIKLSLAVKKRDGSGVDISSTQPTKGLPPPT